MSLRRALVRKVTGEHLTGLHRVLMRGSNVIFMLHRFEDPDRGSRGHSPEKLRLFLRWARSRDISFLSLRDVIEGLRNGARPAGGICFTVDDGYADFATVGMDVFAEFDCPVTVFLPTSFIDGEHWMWWDKVQHLFETSESEEIELPIFAGRERRLQPLRTSSDIRTAITQVEEELRGLSQSELDRALQRLEEALAVKVPASPPERFAPMTWEQVERCGSRGATFAPHTENHPWLSSASDEEVRRQVEGSWERLQDRLRPTDRAVPVFCYPYGTPDSFGEREKRVVEDIGLRGAVSAVNGYVSPDVDGRGQPPLFSLPRFGYWSDLLEMKQIATGLMKLRGYA